MIDASLGPDFSGVQSPEIYFGALRNRNWGNGTPGRVGTVTAVFPKTISKNTLYLDGAWNINEEYAETVGADVRIQFQYDARDVYMVASAAKETAIEVLVDGNRIPLSLAGADVENGVVRVQSERLYHLIKGETYGVHTLELRVRGAGFRAFTFTFG